MVSANEKEIPRANTLEVHASQLGTKENAFDRLGKVFHFRFSRKMTERKRALLEFWRLYFDST